MILFMIACLLMNLQARKLAVRSVPVHCGIRIVHISDLHFDHVLVEPAVLAQEICKCSAEVIVITGDLCSALKYFDRVANFLDMLAYQAECPILITLGNHDHAMLRNESMDKNAFIAAIEEISPYIKVLENTSFRYQNFLFCGLEDAKTNTADVEMLVSQWQRQAKEQSLKLIFLTHNPDLILRLPQSDSAELLLAGHTHGGQVRIPFNIEFTLLKKDVLPKKGIYYGLHSYHGYRLYITSGIGCSMLPIRFRSTPEIAVLE